MLTFLRQQHVDALIAKIRIVIVVLKTKEIDFPRVLSSIGKVINVANPASNPIVLSYRGYIEALVNKEYAEGIRICRESFKILKSQMSLAESFFLPILYLNLGKTYLIANKKKDAYFSFQKGLDIDKHNEDILKELKKLGIRRKPFFPFLKRSNPLNKYIGILTYKLQKKNDATVIENIFISNQKIKHLFVNDCFLSEHYGVFITERTVIWH